MKGIFQRFSAPAQAAGDWTAAGQPPATGSRGGEQPGRAMPARVASADTAARDAPACPALPGSCKGEGIALPSGSRARLLEVVRDTPGPAGTAWRYRFLMPDLARQMPGADLPATEELTPEDMAELDNLGLDPGPSDTGQAADESGLVSPEDLDLPDFAPEDFDARDDGDRQAEDGIEGETGKGAGQLLAVPPDPDVLLLDPVHKDIVWLCEHWILPKIDRSADLPAQIIISLSDRPVEFGTIDTRAVQLFEAFSIAPDRKSCIWEPW